MSEYSGQRLADRFRGYFPVVVDIETAGFNSHTDAILELAATTLNMTGDGQLGVANHYSYAITPFPGANLEPSSLAFTGIDPTDPERQAIIEKQALKELFKAIKNEQKQADCQRCVLVAHNAAFDNGFLNAAINRNNIKRSPFHPFVTFDTSTLAALIFGQSVLSKACDMAGIAFDGQQAHSASYDSLRTAELFCFMVNRYQQLGGWPYLPACCSDDS